MLFLHPIAQAESNATPQESNEKQIQTLQTQISDANGKITVLETALNTANQDIIALFLGAGFDENVFYFLMPSGARELQRVGSRFGAFRQQ